MCYNPRSIRDADVALDTDLGSMPLKSTTNSDKKKRKHDELFKDKIQEKVQNILQAGREKMHESFQGIYQNRCKNRYKHNYNNYWPNHEILLACTALMGHHSSCTSATAIENDDNRCPIDDLEESKECRLVTPVLGIPKIVDYGLARPFIEGTLFNSHLIPKGYAIILVDRVKPGHRRSKLEYPRENGEQKLGKNIGCHILWLKRDIEFGEEDFESSSSDSPLPQ
jgi:hypothetical protein